MIFFFVVVLLKEMTRGDSYNWLISSNHHLSDFERRQLEHERSMSQAQDLDLLTDGTPSGPGEAETRDSLNGVTGVGGTCIPTILPSNAKWFGLDSVHTIEREQLGGLFFGTILLFLYELPE